MTTMTLTATAQVDTAGVKTVVSSNLPDNTSGAISPEDIRNTFYELNRSAANMLERTVFSETVVSQDSVKSDNGFFKWNGSSYSEVGALEDTAIWVRSGGFILAKEFSDELLIDTMRVNKNIYPKFNNNLNIGRTGLTVDSLFLDVLAGGAIVGGDLTITDDLSVSGVTTLDSIVGATDFVNITAADSVTVEAIDLILRLGSGGGTDGMRIIDGTEGLGKVLTSSATGLASWADHPTQRIIVNQSNVSGTLGGTIDSDKQYYIDGSIDMTGVTCTIPSTGIQISGEGFDVSELICADNTYTMFVEDGGCGNVVISDISISVTGTSSQVFDLTGNAGTEAFEVIQVNFNSCTSLGELNDFTQGFESGNGRFGGTPELTLSGDWTGGYRITSSIARGLSTTTLFKAGTALVLNGRFFTDLNMEGQTDSEFSDFSASNIANDGDFEIITADFTRVTDPLPNITGASVKARFRDNAGISNTYVGSQWVLTAEAQTIISTQSVAVKIAGTTTYSGEAWFDNTTDNATRFISQEPVEVRISGTVSLTGGNNDQVIIIIRQWDDSAAGWIDIHEHPVITLDGSGRGENIAVLGIASMEDQDRIELWVSNESGISNIKMLENSLLLVEERAN